MLLQLINCWITSVYYIKIKVNNLGNILYIMLLKELSPLHKLMWFEPVGSKMQILLDLISDQECGGLTNKEVLFLKRVARIVRNLPKNTSDFLLAIPDYFNAYIAVKIDYEEKETAIYSLIWNLILGSKITYQNQRIIEQIWLEIMGYEYVLES